MLFTEGTIFTRILFRKIFQRTHKYQLHFLKQKSLLVLTIVRTIYYKTVFQIVISEYLIPEQGTPEKCYTCQEHIPPDKKGKSVYFSRYG